MRAVPKRREVRFFAFCWLALCAACTTIPGDQADLVLRGGSIYTMDAVRSWAEAVAVRDGEIVYVGPESGLEKYIGPRTRVVDLRGRMVLPAFQDAHIHPVAAGVDLRSLAFYDLKTVDEYLQAVTKHAAAHSGAGWIHGGGWSIPAFSGAVPTRHQLDAVVSDRPVFLLSSDGHTAWVNSKALELAGIDRDTPDPPGGRIDRDPETGEPVGWLREESAMRMVLEHAPPYSAEELEAGLRHALKLLNGYGITSFQDAWVTLEGNDAYRSLETYRALDERGELTARVVAALLWDADKPEDQLERFVELREKYTRGRVRATTVKIMQDGVFEADTASLLEPYVDQPGLSGDSMIAPEKLSRIVTRLDREGFQVHFHAIGDAAVRQCLDAVEAARRANGWRDSRHHISHLQLVHPLDFPRFRELGVVANFQPLWACADDFITELTLPHLDPKRARWLYPIRSLLRSGAVIAFGSDWYVSSANPLEEIEVALTRVSADGSTGEPFIPEERIALPEALAAFTINAAYVNFQEEHTGSIEAGKLADLIVLDRNLFDLAPSELSEARVLLTLLGGAPVHGDLDSL